MPTTPRGSDRRCRRAPRPLAAATLLALALWGAGCATTIPKEALAMTPETLSNRTLQSRSFETADEKALLVAAASLLQDMGYTIDESETKLGLVVGSKNRDATDGGQIFGAAVASALFGTDMLYDSEQQIRACLVTRSREEGGRAVLRVTFQRLVWNNRGALWKREPIHEEAIYSEFFDMLSKAVFLEAHQI
jgi:hypothetical protein